jgi:hypothetical protein
VWIERLAALADAARASSGSNGAGR